MKQRKSEINWKLVVRVACLMLLDVMLLYLACLLALLSRFDLSIHTLTVSYTHLTLPTNSLV